MNVDNAPFLVTKLKVQVLPCVIAFVDGIGVDRIVGFEGLGSGALGGEGSVDGFLTKDLERRLLAARVLVGSKAVKEVGRGGAGGGEMWGKKKKEGDGNEDEDDWD